MSSGRSSRSPCSRTSCAPCSSRSGSNVAYTAFNAGSSTGSSGSNLASLIRVDNAMLPQVVFNLVDNALRYTSAATPIDIAAWANDAQVVVKVADEGPGIAEDETSKVFQRFYRGRTARATGGERGIGLGLTICEGIVRAHGGRIWAEANKPRGVVFYFSLPIERPQPAVPREAAEVAR